MTTENAAIHAAIDGYRRFLETRDGAPDLYRATLARREEFYRRLEDEPVRSTRTFDRRRYLRHLDRDRPEPGLDAEMLWLLATAKANQAERFGVELGRLYGRGPDEGADPEQIHVVLQETYHTRTLAYCLGLFGLPVPPRPPNRWTRLVIHLLVFNRLPEACILPFVGLSEMVGCVSFRLLRERGLELFADEPEVCARIRLLFDEILADEVCHVGLVEARLGPRGRRIMRAAYRLFGAPLASQLAPEFLALVGRDRIRQAIAEPFDQAALARSFPGAAYAF